MITQFTAINPAFFVIDNNGFGVTSTSANHLANLAKHKYESIESFLNGIKLYSTFIQIIGSVEKTLTEQESNIDTVLITEQLDKIAEYKSFIAFLREAIKEKTKLLEEIKNFQLQEQIDLIKPEKPTQLTAEEVIATWNTGEREKYYSLSTFAAIYGKYIHPNGQFFTKRNRFMQMLEHPIDVDTNGRDTIITSFESSYNIQKVDDIFFALQKKQRAFEAELNGILHKIQITIDEDYSTKLAEYQKQVKEYEAKMQVISAEEESIKNKRIQEVSKLKIIIPNKYKELYTSLTTN